MEDRIEKVIFTAIKHAAENVIDSVNKILRRSREDGYEIERFDVTVTTEGGGRITVGANATKKRINGSKF